jgi:hypothetical protein
MGRPVLVVSLDSADDPGADVHAISNPDKGEPSHSGGRFRLSTEGS